MLFWGCYQLTCLSIRLIQQEKSEESVETHALQKPAQRDPRSGGQAIQETDLNLGRKVESGVSRDQGLRGILGM